MGSEWFETAGKHLSISALFVSTFLGIIAWVRKVVKRRALLQKQHDDIMVHLVDIDKSVQTISERLAKVEKCREQDATENLNVRHNIFIGQIAIVSALKEIAEHNGLKINGPVQLYYEQNIQALRDNLKAQEGK